MNKTNLQAKKNFITEKANIDWANLQFSYMPTPYRFQAIYADGAWQKGEVIEDEILHLHEGSTAVHYAQQCFEGMKAQTAADGRVLLFRPEMNWERMNRTAQRLMMPTLPKELFLQGVIEAVRQNYAFIPPFDTGASLYIRPILIGTGKNIGLKAASQYIFRVFVVPVGALYNLKKTITLMICQQDRVAPLGIGNYKAGANYAPGFFLADQARKKGADEIVFLDPLQHRFLEEAGTTNLLIIDKQKRVSSPDAATILPSITRISLMEISEKLLGLETHLRPVDFYAEVDNFAEVCLCGTAAFLAPVGKIIDPQGKSFHFGNEQEMAGPVTQELHTILSEIQLGKRDDPLQWTFNVPLN